MTRPHILIVDDRIEELRLLIPLIREEGFRISVAFDGAEGYRRAQALLPDLIIMDVHMPVLNGFNAARLLQSDVATARIPIIFLSSANDLKDRLEGLENGGVDYISKPYEPEEVIARIRVHLRVGRHATTSTPRAEQAGELLPHNFDRTLTNAGCGYIRSRLSRPPSMAQLAQALNTNEKRLSRAFKNELGMTVFEFLRQERLRQATRLLIETPLSVSQIAYELGFSSPANFATSFRSHTGQTPSDFRSRKNAGP